MNWTGRWKGIPKGVNETHLDQNVNELEFELSRM